MKICSRLIGVIAADFLSELNELKHLVRLSLCDFKFAQEASEMPDKASEKRKMLVAEFCQGALRDEIAPPSIGSVKKRIGKAAIKLGWSFTRTRDVWYADPKISIRGDELSRVEAVSGLLYQARQEVRKNDDAIARATALLGSQDAHLLGEIVAALLQMVGLQNRTGA